MRPPWWWITLSRLMAVMMFLFWPEWNHQPLCQACHNQKTKWLDPATKSKRAAGGFREEEERAANRNNWMYDADESAGTKPPYPWTYKAA